jgi:hypothetical protein
LNNPRQINQIANYALVEWSDNIAISDESPVDYWPTELQKKPAVLDSSRLQKQLYWHAIPSAWPNIDYETFLVERRKLIAMVVRDAYSKLLDSSYEPNYSEPANPSAKFEGSTNTHLGVSLKDLIAEGALTPGVILMPRSEGYDSAAEVTVEGQILLNEQLFETPTAAAAAIGARVNGWWFWIADTPKGEMSLSQIRKLYLAERAPETSDARSEDDSEGEDLSD